MMNKTITQILIVLFAVSVAGALYLSNKNEQQRAHLIAKTVLLKQQDDSLVKLNLELDQNKKHVALYNDTLIDLIDKLSAENRRLAFAYSRISNTAPDVQKISQKSVLVVGRAQHSKYMVTLHSVLADDKVSHAILNTLKKKGFGVIEGVNRKIRQPWMARSSTILYYSSATKKIAEEMARDLRRVTGVSFLVQLGSGLGVRKGEDEWTLFVHYINSNVVSQQSMD